MAVVGWDFCTADGPTERDLLVAAIVHEQLHSLARYPIASQSLMLAADSSLQNTETALKTWLIQRAVSDQDPAKTRASLGELRRKERNYSPRTRLALRRWDNALHEWSSAGRSISSHHEVGAQEVRNQEVRNRARERYFEAKGYSGIDRGFDAAVHFLWVISDLTGYLVSHPAAPDAPEVLLLLGDAYFELGDVLPVNVRPDRILHLVYEYYPESVWAKRAEALWIRGRRDAI